MAVILPSWAAARAPPSLAGARLTIAGESRLQPPEAGRNYAAVLLPPPLGEGDCLREVFPPFASGSGDVLRFCPPAADAFPPLRMRDEARAATAAQQARVASSRADVLISGALDAALRARDTTAKATVEGEGGAAIEAVGADGSDDASEACSAPATAGNKRSREESREVVATTGEGVCCTQTARHLRESVVRRKADANVSCDGRAVSLLCAALRVDSPAAAPPGAGAAASVVGGRRTLPRFSDAEVAGARATAQKQLNCFAPAATCAHCLCEHADKTAYSAFSARLSMLMLLPRHPSAPAPVPAVATTPQQPPASLADAVKAWTDVRRGCEQRSAVLGDYAQGELECNAHWKLRIRTQGLLRRICTASVESRYVRCRNAAAHAAAALLLDDFGGLAPEYYVKGSAEAAAAASRAAAAEAVVAAAAVPSSVVDTAPSQSCDNTSLAVSSGSLHPPAGRALELPAPTAVTKRAAKPALAASAARATAVRDFFAHVAACVRHGVVEGGADAAARAAGVATMPAAAASTAAAPSEAMGHDHSNGGDSWSVAWKRADAAAFLGAVAGLLESSLRCLGAADAAMKPFEAALLVRLKMGNRKKTVLGALRGDVHGAGAPL